MYRLAYRRYRLPFRQAVRTAHGTWAEREGLLLRVEREDGSVGYGEVTPIPWFGTETLEEAEACVKGLGAFPGMDLLESIPTGNPCLMHAMTMALRGGVCGKPEYGGALPVAALLPGGRVALERIGEKVEAGFRTFKWKVGVGPLDDELAMLDDLLAELPEGSRLRLDANGAWDRRKSERWLECCADRPVEFIEQPVDPHAKGSVDLLVGLAGDYPTPLALDESVTSAGDVQRWLELGWPGVFVIKPSLLGDAGHAVAALEARGAQVVFSSALETGIGARAALEMAFGFKGKPRAVGFGVWPLFQDARFDGPHLAPFIRRRDVSAIDQEAIWNAAG